MQPQQVQVVFVRDTSKTGYDTALVSTQMDASAAQVIERYAGRWSIEVAIANAKQNGGVDQPATAYFKRPRPAVGLGECRGVDAKVERSAQQAKRGGSSDKVLPRHERDARLRERDLPPDRAPPNRRVTKSATAPPARSPVK